MDIVLPQQLAALPAWLGILLTTAVPVGIAIVLGRVMYALFTQAEFQANAIVGGIKYGFVVEIYAVVAALALVGAWDTFQTARENVRQETRARPRHGPRCAPRSATTPRPWWRRTGRRCRRGCIPTGPTRPSSG